MKSAFGFSVLAAFITQIVFVAFCVTPCASHVLVKIPVRVRPTHVELQNSTSSIYARPFLQSIFEATRFGKLVPTGCEEIGDGDIICRAPYEVFAYADILIPDTYHTVEYIKRVSSIFPADLVVSNNAIRFAKFGNQLPPVYVTTSRNGYIGVLQRIYYNEAIEYYPESTVIQVDDESTQPCSDCDGAKNAHLCQQYVSIDLFKPHSGHEFVLAITMTIIFGMAVCMACCCAYTSRRR